MVGLPHSVEFLSLAEALEPRGREKALPNQVTFGIYRNDQLMALGRVLARKGIIPIGTTTSRTGLHVGFSTEEDAVLAKMSFDGS